RRPLRAGRPHSPHSVRTGAPVGDAALSPAAWTWWMNAMAWSRNVRDRMNVKLDGWQAYVRAIGAQLDPNGNDALDRVQACKNRLREALERLERAAHEAKPLASAARSRLCRATSRLRTELRTPRPHNAAIYAEQKQTIAAAIRTAETE